MPDMNQNKLLLIGSLSLTMGAFSAQAQFAQTGMSLAGIIPDAIGCPWTPLYIPSNTNFLTVNKGPSDPGGEFKVYGDRKGETSPFSGKANRQ
jgi:hypothetical protein